MSRLRISFTLLLLAGLLFSGMATGSSDEVTNQELVSAIHVYRSEGPEASFEDFNRLLAEFESSGDKVSEATTLRYIGESRWRFGEYKKARSDLDHALMMMRDLSDKQSEGKIINVLGLLDWDLGNYQAAIGSFQQASQIGTELGDNRLAGATLNNLSLVYDELGDYQTSLEQYRQVLKLYQGVDFLRGEGDTLGNIGGVYLLLGRYPEALEHYQRALAISEELKSKPSMSQDHGNLGLCYLGLGHYDAALLHFETALGLARETGMRQDEAFWQRGKANALIRKGQYGQGLDNHRAALAIYEELQSRGVLLDGLHDMGNLHLLLGDPVAAQEYFQRAMNLAREIGNTGGITINLLALGDLQYERERYEEAVAYYQQALNRARDANELGIQADSLVRLSRVHRDQKKLTEAGAEASEAEGIAEQIKSTSIQADALYSLGELARLEGKVEEALNYYSAARKVASEIDPDLMWQIHYGQAQTYVQSGLDQAAIPELQAAVGIIEGIRDRLREKRFRTGYLQDKCQVYIDLVRLQLELGLTHEAFSTAQRLRARSYLAQLNRVGPVGRTENERQTEIALRERIRQLQSALEEEYDKTVPQRRQLAVAAFSSELQQAEREYEAFLDDMNGRHIDYGYFVEPLAPKQIQKQLRPGDALVEYVVADNNVMIFIMRREELAALSTPVSSSDLAAKVNLLRELIKRSASDRWIKPAASLSTHLVEPLRQKGMLENVEHLYLIPHDVLNYLPFAVLPLGNGGDGGDILEEFTISYLPAAAALVQNGGISTAPRSLLALAPETARLRHATDEARSIVDIYQPDAQLLAGRQATESEFKSLAGNYRVLHLATHGYFNKKNPLLSGLELEADQANNGLLEVHEILGLSLDAGLVTLSACQTGLGSGYFNEFPAGDDFVGLTHAFLAAGSRSVLATLWAVDDRSTVELMERFYGQLGKPGSDRTQAQALALVQRELRASKKFNHPFYWAPFVLVGSQDRQMGL